MFPVLTFVVKIVSVAPPAGVFLYLEFYVLLKADTFTRPLIRNRGKTASEVSEQQNRVSALMLPDSLVSVDGWTSARFPSLTHPSQFPTTSGSFSSYRGCGVGFILDKHRDVQLYSILLAFFFF